MSRIRYLSLVRLSGSGSRTALPSFVRGDAKWMAKDVDAALHQIAQEHGGLSEDEAIVFFKQLKKDKRYLRDVY